MRHARDIAPSAVAFCAETRAVHAAEEARGLPDFVLGNVGDFEAVHRVVEERLRGGLGFVFQALGAGVFAESAVEFFHYELGGHGAQVGRKALGLLLAVNTVADKRRGELEHIVAVFLTEDFVQSRSPALVAAFPRVGFDVLEDFARVVAGGLNHLVDIGFEVEVYGVGVHLVDFQAVPRAGCGVDALAARGEAQAHNIPFAVGNFPFEVAVLVERVPEDVDILALDDCVVGHFEVVIGHRAAAGGAERRDVDLRELRLNERHFDGQTADGDKLEALYAELVGSVVPLLNIAVVVVYAGYAPVLRLGLRKGDELFARAEVYVRYFLEVFTVVGGFENHGAGEQPVAVNRKHEHFGFERFG